MTDGLPTIAILGGTGAEGQGLALRWAHAGYAVIIGSREADKAREAAAALKAGLAAGSVVGMDNAAAAGAADIAVLTVPFAAQRATLERVKDALSGKILVDVTAPLVPPHVSRVQLPAEGSAAAAAQAILGDAVKVVSAFQNVAAERLRNLDEDTDCDVLVTGDDADAREEVVALAHAAGMRAYHAGPLDNAVAAESLTSILIWINRRYKVPGLGIRITGLEGRGDEAEP